MFFFKFLLKLSTDDITRSLRVAKLHGFVPKYIYLCSVYLQNRLRYYTGVHIFT